MRSLFTLMASFVVLSTLLFAGPLGVAQASSPEFRSQAWQQPLTQNKMRGLANRYASSIIGAQAEHPEAKAANPVHTASAKARDLPAAQSVSSRPCKCKCHTYGTCSSGSALAQTQTTDLALGGANRVTLWGHDPHVEGVAFTLLEPPRTTLH